MAQDPTVLTPLPPDPGGAEAKGGKPLESKELRRETYKPKPAKEGKEGKEGKASKAGDSFGKEANYREPILAWLASLVGLVIIGGGIFLFLLIAVFFMS